MLSIKTSALLKITFLLYVVPILLLIIGAVIGHTLGAYLRLNPSAASATGGFLFFLLTLWRLKSKANRLAQKNEYQPKIIKIIT